jgi:preprotein translocase subunit SecE
MLINSQWFKDVLWLKLTDMFIYTALVMLIVAAIGVVIGASGMMRKVKR